MSDIAPIEQTSLSAEFDQEQVRQVIPLNILDENPKLKTFFDAYYEWLNDGDNTLNKLKRLRQIKNPDTSEFLTSLLNEFGERIPNTGNISSENILKILYLFYDAKGNEESIEAYFRLFLNTQASVTYPKDNILRVDDGVWDDVNKVYLTNQGHLDDRFYVLQDDLFYQIYSYVINSGLSVSQWGDIFNELVHPAGWIFFGEIEALGFARFRFDGLSPLIVPGRQEFETPGLQITGSAVHDEDAILQKLDLDMNPQAIFDYDSFDLGYNILGSQTTVGEIGDFTVGQLSIQELAITTNLRRGSTVTIT